jgi:hypothetical protein
MPLRLKLYWIKFESLKRHFCFLTQPADLVINWSKLFSPIISHVNLDICVHRYLSTQGLEQLSHSSFLKAFRSEALSQLEVI